MLSAEQAILLDNLPLECDLIPGAVLFSRLCTCVGKSHLYLAQESLSITELVLVKQEQELISGDLSVPDSKAQLKMGFAQPLLVSDEKSCVSQGFTQQIAQELLGSSALSSQGPWWKHQPSSCGWIC